MALGALGSWGSLIRFGLALAKGHHHHGLVWAFIVLVLPKSALAGMQWLPQRLHLPALSRGDAANTKDIADAEHQGYPDTGDTEPSGAQADDDAASLLPSEQPTAAVVKITGSTTRDHLANERTFLAYLRTALSSVALGLALAKFTVGMTSIVGGTLFIAMGMVILAYSGHRYYSVEDGIKRGDYVLPRNGINLMLLLACVGTVAALAFVLLTPTPNWMRMGAAEQSSTWISADSAVADATRLR